VRLVHGKSGAQSSFSYQSHPKRGSAKTFVCNLNRTRLWQLRLLAHYLNGRQTAFLMPTFGGNTLGGGGDVLLQGNLTSGGSTMAVQNTGITANGALGVDPRVYLRCYTTASSTGHVDMQVLSTSVVNSGTENVYVTPTFPFNIPVSTVSRICVLEKCRSDSDVFKINHTDLNGTAIMAFPTKAVLN